MKLQMIVKVDQKMMKEISCKMEHNKIIPTKPIPNDKLKRNRKLQIFVQYANFKDINDYKTGYFIQS